MATHQDLLNRSTWSRASSRKWLDTFGDFTDHGERVALDLLRDGARGKPILDLGVGTGRTIPLLSPLTNEYRAIDYLPEMVATCRARHPNVDVSLGDARDLRDVPSGHFGLVSFSFNGLDSVAHDDRARVLAEMRRVVRPDGLVWFSTLNLAGPAFRERPWIPRRALSQSRLRRIVRDARAWASVPFDVVRWMRLQKRVASGDGWAVAPLSAHHYGVLVHFTTLAKQLEELEAAALDRDVMVIENECGTRVSPSDEASGAAWFHVIARPR